MIETHCATRAAPSRGGCSPLGHRPPEVREGHADGLQARAGHRRPTADRACPKTEPVYVSDTDVLEKVVRWARPPASRNTRGRLPSLAPAGERIRRLPRDLRAVPRREASRRRPRAAWTAACPFCHSGCPLGNIIPDWNDLVYRNRWREALDRLHATNNFPEFTGRLCPAPCEEACVLGINEPAVTIELIEKTIIEHALRKRMGGRPGRRRGGPARPSPSSAPARPAWRAPSSSTAPGIRSTVFERADRIGGLLRYGIPDFKLEKWVLDRRLGSWSRKASSSGRA